MCGIFGVVGKNNINDNQYEISSKKYLGKRGPDGLNSLRRENLFLSHSRLAINDLTFKGEQPFHDKKEIVFSITNGEIYNHEELRKKDKINIQTNNDCAIIPDLYLLYGINFLSKLRGMFAMAVADYKNKIINICRDSEGIKPLYYFEDENFMAFSSSNQQLASLFNLRQIDPLAIQIFLAQKYIPAPMSGFSKIKKLMPGEIRTYDLNGKFLKSGKIRKEISKIYPINLRSLIVSSIKEHLSSDVKISALLSGGIDSSIITYEAHQIMGDIDTFTTYQEDPTQDLDVIHSNILCKSLGKKNNLIKIPKLTLEKLYEPVCQLSEPNADSAFITGYYLIKQINNTNKVLLSGEGADELFGGYGIYEKFLKRNNKISKYSYLLDLIINKNKEIIPKIFYRNNISRKIFKNLDNSSDVRLILFSLYAGLPISLIKSIFPEIITRLSYLPDNNFPNSIQEYELNEFMPNYFLNKVDSMSMLNSVEMRTPFVSGEIRQHFKSFINKGYNKNKEYLKEKYKNIIPKEIIERKKLGFTRELSIFRNYKLWKTYYDQIDFEYFIDNKVPIINSIKFTLNNSVEAIEMRWRIFVLISWLSGNDLYKKIII